MCDRNSVELDPELMRPATQLLMTECGVRRGLSPKESFRGALGEHFDERANSCK